MMCLREQPSDGSFLMWWLGQSGFAVRYHEGLAVLDPYLSDSLTTKYANSATPHVRMQPIFIEPNYLAQALLTVVSATHQHTDHLDPETLRPMADRFRTWDRTLPLIAPEAWRNLAAERAGMEPASILGIDVGTPVYAGWFEFFAIPSAHESIELDESGHNKYLGYVVRFGPWTIYHSGDTILYDGMVEKLRPFNIDVAILPINGRSPERRVAGNLWGREAAWLAKQIGAKLVIPCHYDMFEFNTATPDEFVAECQRLGQPYRVLKLGERWSSTELNPR
jgi:L-ascorbate metabolism protein UlaG (beta-lactamase superfamily)